MFTISMHIVLSNFIFLYCVVHIFIFSLLYICIFILTNTLYTYVYNICIISIFVFLRYTFVCLFVYLLMNLAQPSPPTVPPDTNDVFINQTAHSPFQTLFQTPSYGRSGIESEKVVYTETRTK